MMYGKLYFTMTDLYQRKSIFVAENDFFMMRCARIGVNWSNWKLLNF